jgi:hypothetical protein
MTKASIPLQASARGLFSRQLHQLTPTIFSDSPTVAGANDSYYLLCELHVSNLVAAVSNRADRSSDVQSPDTGTPQRRLILQFDICPLTQLNVRMVRPLDARANRGFRGPNQNGETDMTFSDYDAASVIPCSFSLVIHPYRSRTNCVASLKTLISRDSFIPCCSTFGVRFMCQ